MLSIYALNLLVSALLKLSVHVGDVAGRYASRYKLAEAKVALWYGDRLIDLLAVATWIRDTLVKFVGM